MGTNHTMLWPCCNYDKDIENLMANYSFLAIRKSMCHQHCIFRLIFLFDVCFLRHLYDQWLKIQSLFRGNLDRHTCFRMLLKFQRVVLSLESLLVQDISDYISRRIFSDPLIAFLYYSNTVLSSFFDFLRDCFYAIKRFAALELARVSRDLRNTIYVCIPATFLFVFVPWVKDISYLSTQDSKKMIG